MHRVVVSVGSNIEPEANVSASEQVLSNETNLIDSADAIETAPVGYQDQPNFLNTAYLIETSLSHQAFNAFLKSVEDRLGRERGPIKSGPRTIDLDIIIWDGDVVTSDYYDHEYVSVPVNQLVKAHNLEINTQR